MDENSLNNTPETTVDAPQPPPTETLTEKPSEISSSDSQV